MPSPLKISKVRLQAADLVPIIQRRGNEQGVEVAGPYAHYAYEQANLHLLAEDLFDMLARVVRAAKGAGVSQALQGEASVLLDRVILNQY